MIFKEIKLKNILDRFQKPQYPVMGERVKKITGILLIVSFIALFISAFVAMIGFFATFISFLFMQKFINFFFRYNNKVEIKDGVLTVSFDSGIGKKKMSVTEKFEISKVDGFEYFTTSKEIAILAPIVYDNGFKDYGFCIDNVFQSDFLNELKKIKPVTYVREGDFGSKWRSE